MFKINFCSTICLIAILTSGLKVSAGPLPKNEVDPELTAGYYGGDMLLTEDQLQSLVGGSSKIQGRNGLVSETKRWPNKIVYYKIVGDFDAAHREAILEAIETIEARTCVRFKEADANHPHYVQITSQSGGCFTAVGYLAKVQQMNLQVFPLNEGCFRTGSILHEFMHALGFYHEQSDSQRDDFIEVLYENIQKGKEFNFEKYKSTFVTDFDVGYDYGSVMHYGPVAFSSNGKATIRTINPEKVEIGQRVGLSKKDIDKINVMYKCPIKI